jgi:hypothetical protein
MINDTIEYVLINAYKIIIDKIEFSVQINNIIYHYVFYYNNYNKSQSNFETNFDINLITINDKILSYLKNKNYKIGTVENINVTSNKIYIITINNIINSWNIIYKYNYCLKLLDSNDILKTIYNYELDTLQEIITRRIFNIN